MEASGAVDSFVRNHAGVSDQVPAEALRQRQQLDQVREAQRQQAARYVRYTKVDFEPATAPPDIMACTECGTIQPAEVLSRMLYRCIGCGNIQSRLQYPGSQSREAGPRLSL